MANETIILCGGQSTRLPNKLLLPVRRADRLGTVQPLYEQSMIYSWWFDGRLRYLLRSGSLFERLLRASGIVMDSDRPIHQSGGDILHAMDAIWKQDRGDVDFYTILCGDNTYPWLVPADLTWRSGTLTCVKMHPQKAVGLTVWNDYDDEFCRMPQETADAMDDVPVIALATPWMIPAAFLHDDPPLHFKSIEEWLTKGIKSGHLHRIVLDRYDGWSDLGTEERYLEHWTNHQT